MKACGNVTENRKVGPGLVLGPLAAIISPDKDIVAAIVKLATLAVGEQPDDPLRQIIVSAIETLVYPKVRIDG